MGLERITKLHSVELIIGVGLHAAWHTYVTEEGVVISGPSVHRRAFANDMVDEVLPEIQGVISADYVQLLAEAEQLALSLQTAQVQIEAQAAQLQAAESRVIELETLLLQQSTAAVT